MVMSKGVEGCKRPDTYGPRGCYVVVVGHRDNPRYGEDINGLLVEKETYDEKDRKSKMTLRDSKVTQNPETEPMSRKNAKSW